MVVDQFPCHVADALRVGARLQKLRHPLLEDRGLADLPAAGQGVDAGAEELQTVEERGTIGKWQLGHLPQVGVALREFTDRLPVGVVWQETRIHRLTPMFRHHLLNKFSQYQLSIPNCVRQGDSWGASVRRGRVV